MNLTFRKAGDQDLDFILEAILASEMSGTDVLSYQRIFGLEVSQVLSLVKNILEEDIEGQEWCLSSFRIAEADGEAAACLSAWIEGEQGQGSGILKAQAMSYFLGDLWMDSKSNLEIVSGIQIPRIFLALQLENIYTKPAYRGYGIAGKLIDETVNEFREKSGMELESEIQLMGNNENAVRSYTKCGFLERARSFSADNAVLNLLPGNYRI